VPRPKKPQDVLRILHEYDARFQFNARRGKGSERMIYHPNINGRSQCIPLTFHKGKDVGKGMLSAIIRRFDLPSNIFG
jgi:predicted RNA binding protein YcfA (HicA-like mRNA interferase family)